MNGGLRAICRLLKPLLSNQLHHTSESNTKQGAQSGNFEGHRTGRNEEIWGWAMGEFEAGGMEKRMREVMGVAVVC